MVARSIKLQTPGRDNELVARCAEIAQQPMCCGFTVSKAGREALKDAIDPQGRLFGVAVFDVPGQPQRVRVWWKLPHLDRYLTRLRQKGLAK